ncbi:hypothetical protein GGTG_02455 [Gaeumannomyces tritici R3-111a-1]|uniref:Heterokaryon incompatibility domain-containing protein n=1 Tax=Gaeumannomyces tritici (strain R3-111a-1) TaxID=644352 RepID=J3NMF1_GAET3|nr:hypothetical protein GGTG_02455 [Gaeumannomyces tritici R3-111a-1]EJT82482.1 hypothetical protein GGTG_02455 [Gaeumannomyces tritici R3-111a-1]
MENWSIQTTYELVDEYPDFPALATSAQLGCGLCRIIRKALRQNWAVRPMDEQGIGPLSDDDSLLDEPWDGKVRISNLNFSLDRLEDAGLSHPKQMGGVLARMHLRYGLATIARSEDGSALHEDISQAFGFEVYDSVAVGRNQRPIRRLPSPESLSAENVEMMRQWIRDCQSHAPCRLPESSKPWLPTRLLDVGSAEDDRAPRLVLTSTSQVEGAIYAALSHMWGDAEAAPPFQTSQYNYEEAKMGIPMSVLPQNFRDAIETCRHLDVPFIWIDSLCIIQDSIDDWQREAKEMHNVYKHAYFTIAATSATSSHDGFLARNLSLVPAIKTQYSIAGDNQPRFLVLSPLDDSGARSRMGDVEGSRWNTRGWTMQERALSTRTLHFCKNKIYFECREHGLSEGEDTRESGRSRYIWPRPPDGHPVEQPTWYKYWMQAVQDYSGRRLTVPSDKLTAIRSLANEMSPHMEASEYMPDMAMWTGNFTNELLWYGRDIATKPRQWRAPSWSWASLDVIITFASANIYPGIVNRFSWTACRLPPPNPSAWTSVPSITLGGFTRLIGARGLQQTKDEDRRERTRFHYDVFDNEGRQFAHGNLDLSGRDGLLTRNNPLMYVHVAGDRRPSGLILESYDDGTHWSRVGVAMLFESYNSSPEPIDPDVWGKLEEKTGICLLDRDWIRPLLS